jgi:hypothetical protein
MNKKQLRKWGQFSYWRKKRLQERLGFPYNQGQIVSFTHERRNGCTNMIVVIQPYFHHEKLTLRVPKHDGINALKAKIALALQE